MPEPRHRQAQLHARRIVVVASKTRGERFRAYYQGEFLGTFDTMELAERAVDRALPRVFPCPWCHALNALNATELVVAARCSRCVLDA